MELFNTSARTVIPIKRCVTFPANTHSIGLWNKTDYWRVNATLPYFKFSFPLQNYTIPVLEVEMLSMFFVTQISHFFLKMIGLPMFVAELLVSSRIPIFCFFFFSLVFSGELLQCERVWNGIIFRNQSTRSFNSYLIRR